MMTRASAQHAAAARLGREIPVLCHLIGADGNSVLGMPQDELARTLDVAADSIPATVIGIFRFWRAQT